MMIRSSKALVGLAGAALMLAYAPQPALAHHSFSMFDPAKPLKFEATVQNFQWTAPHAVLWVEAGQVGAYTAGIWALELPTSPANLSKMGWSRTVVKPGDRIVVEINPIHDGRRAGQFKKLTVLASGQVLAATNIPGQAQQPPK
jgi:hypothetical protein